MNETVFCMILDFSRVSRLRKSMGMLKYRLFRPFKYKGLGLRYGLYIEQINRAARPTAEKIARARTASEDPTLPDAPPAEIPRIIWMFWAQGTEEMPELARICLQQWQKLHPDWDIRVLDAQTMSDFVDTMDIDPESFGWTKFSDVLRLRLLEKYGGVWADASTFPHRPLDDWLEPLSWNGFFAFSSPAPDRLIENWLIASAPAHPVVGALERGFASLLLNTDPNFLMYFAINYHQQWMLRKPENKLEEVARRAMTECTVMSSKPCEILGKSTYYSDAPQMFAAYLAKGLPLSKLNFKRPYPRERLLELLEAPAPGSLAKE